MNTFRLMCQLVLGYFARLFGLNHKLSQFCNRCGRTDYVPFWTANDVWEAIAGNVNGCRHGAFCVSCFNYMAIKSAHPLNWTCEFRKE